MKVVIQRVRKASVMVAEKRLANIANGFVLLLGIGLQDTQEDIVWLANKITNLRIFEDASGVMNLSLKDIDGEVILVSQFTLMASTKKGNRPSYIKAAKPEIAKALYKQFIKELEQNLGKKIGTGVFGAMMQVSLINDGPITILLDSKNKE